LHKLGIERDEASSVSFLATLISMVEAGFGTAVMPTFAVAACRRHNVQVDLLGSPQIKLGFYRITRRGAGETDAMKTFDDALAQQLPLMSR
jgi:DNA-binding transcriptional LysR family regulator